MRKCRGKSNIDIVKDYVAGVRPFTQVSTYISEKDKYKEEGETWVDKDGIKWKKKNGKSVKVTKSKGDVIRNAIDNALDCKMCNAKWKFASTHDRKFLTRTGLCEDCIINYETKLRILGIYNVYEKYRLASYELGYLKNLREKIIETIEWCKNPLNKKVTYYTDDGLEKGDINEHTLIENDSEHLEKLKTNAEHDLKKTEELIEKGIGITKGFKDEYLKKIKEYNLLDIITK